MNNKNMGLSSPLFNQQKGTHVCGESQAPPMNIVARDPAPTAADFRTLTHMASAVDWNLSSIVPAKAKAVILRVKLQDDTVGSYYAVFRHDVATDMCKLWTQAANAWTSQIMACPIGTDGIIMHQVFDANGSPAAVSNLSVTVVGWLEPMDGQP